MICRSYLLGRFCFRVRALRFSVVIDIETGALEHDSDREEDFAQLAAALLARSKSVFGDLLDDLEPMTALRALVFVSRHYPSFQGRVIY